MLIDPGFSMIAVPKNDFDAFVMSLNSTYIMGKIICDYEDWCFTLDPCSSLYDKMPDLEFKFKVEHELEELTFKVPARQYAYDQFIPTMDTSICHIGVVSQNIADSDMFVFGETFMQNFYTTFDARDPMNLKVGLSYDLQAELNERNMSFALTLVLIFAGVLAVLVAVMTACICMRKRREKRLDKAKAYFDSLKTGADGDGERLDLSDGEDANAEDPNSALLNNSGKQEGEAPEQTQTVGDLL